jgi:plasmid stabilization system protein ParE
MRKVFWNKLAKVDYYKIVDYLIENWGENTAQNFIDEVDKIESILESGEADLEITNRKNIRRCVLSKQVTLFYKTYGKDSVELLRFWNNYQDKRKMNLLV